MKFLKSYDDINLNKSIRHFLKPKSEEEVLKKINLNDLPDILLLKSVKYDILTLTKIAMERGADPYYPLNYGFGNIKSIIDLAFYENRHDIINYLMDNYKIKITYKHMYFLEENDNLELYLKMFKYYKKKMLNYIKSYPISIIRFSFNGDKDNINVIKQFENINLLDDLNNSAIWGLINNLHLNNRHNQLKYLINLDSIKYKLNDKSFNNIKYIINRYLIK